MASETIARVRERIASACLRAGRDPASVTLVAVSKNRSAAQIKEALEAGIADIGENRVQEAVVKFNQLRTTNYALRTHLIGHLQTNKVKEAVKLFDLIHSVDSILLAQAINKQAAAFAKIQEILLEVKTSPEESKFGIKPDEAVGVAKEISQLENLKLLGLMTIAPPVTNPEEARPYFRALKELSDKLFSSLVFRPSSIVLSMGMTDDFEVAIEEGSTMVRLGRAIFETTDDTD